MTVRRRHWQSEDKEWNNPEEVVDEISDHNSRSDIKQSEESPGNYFYGKTDTTGLTLPYIHLAYNSTTSYENAWAWKDLLLVKVKWFVGT